MNPIGKFLPNVPFARVSLIQFSLSRESCRNVNILLRYIGLNNIAVTLS